MTKRIAYLATQERIDALVHCEEMDEVVEALKDGLQQTLDGIRLAVAAYRRLKELGGDPSVYFDNRAMQRLFERMAVGVMLPDYVFAFLKKPRMWDIGQNLTIEEQERLARNEPLRLYRLDNDHRMVRPHDLEPSEIDQLFDKDGIRGEREQIVYLEQKAQMKLAIRGKQKERELTYKPEKGRKRVYFDGTGYLTFRELERIIKNG